MSSRQKIPRARIVGASRIDWKYHLERLAAVAIGFSVGSLIGHLGASWAIECFEIMFN